MLGNVKFIGELGRLDLLSEAILHKCIKTLLEKQRDEKYSQMAEDLECLCKMMPTIGKKLDQGEAVKLMDQYFERMKKLKSIGTTNSSTSAQSSSSTKVKDSKDCLPQRIKFLLQDCIDLRANNWVPRQTQLDQAPKTMNEVRMSVSNSSTPALSQQQQQQYHHGLDGSGLIGITANSTSNLIMMNMYHQFSQQPNMTLLNAINGMTNKLNKQTKDSYPSSSASSSPLSSVSSAYSGVDMKKSFDTTDATRTTTTPSATTTTNTDSSSVETITSAVAAVTLNPAPSTTPPTGNGNATGGPNQVSAATASNTGYTRTNYTNTRNNYNYNSSNGQADFIQPHNKPHFPYQNNNNPSMNNNSTNNGYQSLNRINRKNLHYQPASQNFNHNNNTANQFNNTNNHHHHHNNNNYYISNNNSNNNHYYNQFNNHSNNHNQAQNIDHPHNNPPYYNNNRYQNNANNSHNLNQNSPTTTVTQTAQFSSVQPPSYTAQYQQPNNQRSVSSSSSFSSASSSSVSPPLQIKPPIQQTVVQNPPAQTQTPPPPPPPAVLSQPSLSQSTSSASSTQSYPTVPTPPTQPEALPYKQFTETKPNYDMYPHLGQSEQRPAYNHHNNNYNNNNNNNNHHQSSYNPHFNNRNNYNYNSNNRYLANARNALGVTNDEVLPLNKPIIPINKVIKVDPKQLKQQSKQQQSVESTANGATNTTGSSNTNSSSSISKDLNKTIIKILDEFLTDSSNNEEEEDKNALIDRAIAAFRQLKLTNEQIGELISLIVVHTLSKTDIDRLNVSKLFIVLNKSIFNGSSAISAELFMNGFKIILQNLHNLESEYHCVKSNISLFAARAVCDSIITFTDLSSLMKHGAYYPLFFLCMQNIHKLKTPEWLRSQLEKSKINLVDMLPPGDRNKERLIQILEDRELSFVYPMLKIESLLFEKIHTAGLDSAQLKEWIEANVNADITNSVDFIQSLVTCIVKNAAEKSLLAEENKANFNNKFDIVLVNKQKQSIEIYQSLLQEYLNSNMSKQVEAIYAMQVYAGSKGFPKYFLAHLFNQMYALEIIEEDAFYLWKDEINENYPNKGQALFCLQRWFNWLAEAESE